MSRRDEVEAEFRTRFRDGVPYQDGHKVFVATGQDAEKRIADMVDLALRHEAESAVTTDQAELDAILDQAEKGRASLPQMQRALVLLARNRHLGQIAPS